MINNLVVCQQGHTYAVYTPQGEQIALLFMGYDGQFAKDIIALNPITKALAKRWSVPNSKDN